MKELRLTQGQVTVIDDDDYAFLSQWKWQARRNPSGAWYACRNWEGPRHLTGRVYVHRLLVNAPKSMDVDHANGDTLDNRKCNLRVATRSQNLANMRSKNPSSGFKGVYPHGKEGWVVKFTCERQRVHVGTFRTLREAVLAYNAHITFVRGEFAWLNEVPS